MFNVQCLLHPTDFSPCSNSAFQLAYALARDYGARLVVLHVAAPPAIGSAGLILLPPAVNDEEDLEAVRQHVQAPDSKISVEYRLERGEPAERIIAVAQDIS